MATPQSPEVIKKTLAGAKLVQAGASVASAARQVGLSWSQVDTAVKKIGKAPKTPRAAKLKHVVTFPVLDIGGTVTLSYAQLAAFVKELLRA